VLYSVVEVVCCAIQCSHGHVSFSSVQSWYCVVLYRPVLIASYKVACWCGEVMCCFSIVLVMSCFAQCSGGPVGSGNVLARRGLVRSRCCHVLSNIVLVKRNVVKSGTVLVKFSKVTLRCGKVLSCCVPVKFRPVLCCCGSGLVR
jgi:hypothetical protein